MSERMGASDDGLKENSRDIDEADVPGEQGSYLEENSSANLDDTVAKAAALDRGVDLAEGG